MKNQIQTKLFLNLKVSFEIFNSDIVQYHFFNIFELSGNKDLKEAEKLQSFASSLGTPDNLKGLTAQGFSLHKLQGLTAAEIAVVQNCNVKFDVQGKTAHKLLGITGKTFNEKKKAAIKPFIAKPTESK